MPITTRGRTAGLAKAIEALAPDLNPRVGVNDDRRIPARKAVIVDLFGGAIVGGRFPVPTLRTMLSVVGSDWTAFTLIVHPVTGETISFNEFTEHPRTEPDAPAWAFAALMSASSQMGAALLEAKGVEVLEDVAEPEARAKLGELYLVFTRMQMIYDDLNERANPTVLDPHPSLRLTQ